METFPQEKIKKIVTDNSSNLSTEEKEKLEEILNKIINDGFFPAEAVGLDQSYLDNVYSFAYALYQKNQFEEARQLFDWLKMMSPFNFDYSSAAVHCFIQQKKWTLAVNALMEMAVLLPENPYPYAKMADCLIELGDFGGALIATEQAINRSENNPKLVEEREKWKLQFEYLIDQLEIDPSTVEGVMNKNSLT